jgi:hypothetical protein
MTDRAYQQPRPRLDVIAVFAGPALYREMTFVDWASFNALKGERSLRESMGLAGWSGESMGRYWLSKMAMLEELGWTDEVLQSMRGDLTKCVEILKINPSFLALTRLRSPSDVVSRFQLGLTAINPHIPNIIASVIHPGIILREVSPENNILSFELQVSRKFKGSRKVECRWHFVTYKSMMRSEAHIVVGIVKAMLSHPLTTLTTTSLATYMK